MPSLLKVLSLPIVVMALAACNLTYETPPLPQESGLAAEELLEWTFAGMGAADVAGERRIRLLEAEESQGVMLISPETYGEEVVLAYEVKPLNPDSVLVAILSLSDDSEGMNLTVPNEYDGAMSWLASDTEGYFFAFHNKSHHFTPFVRKLPMADRGDALASYEQNFMRHDVWYQVVAGRDGNRVWLDVDGFRVLDAVDDSPLPGGRVALRLRGNPGAPAGCEIQNVRIY